MECIYCGLREATERDHVPPKSLFREPYPANLLTVPACTPCNRGFSKDEEYFRLVIVGLLCHTDEAEQLFDGKISDSMNRNRRIEELMFGSLEAAAEAVVLDVDYLRIFRVAEKIARGLEFATTGYAYSPEQQFEVEFAEVDAGSGETAFGPDFTYERLSYHQGGWEFVLFESVRFEVRPLS